MRKLYVYGDSHTTYFTGDKYSHSGGGEYTDCGTDELPLRVMKLAGTGPTMRGLTNPKSRTGAGVRAKQELDALRPQNVMFVLGEVDCREIIAGREDVEVAAKESVDRFENFRQTLPEVKQLGLFGVCPPQRELVRTRGLWRMPTAVLCFNDALREYCSTNGFKFVSIYQDVVDDRGFLSPRYRQNDGLNVHLRPALTQPLVMRRLVDAFVDAE